MRRAADSSERVRYLPRAGQDAPAQLHTSQPAAAAGPPSSQTVLVVEDELVVCQFARRVLERCGYHVLEAATSDDACQMVEAHTGPIDVLLTDVVMPQSSGPHLARGLQSSRPELKVLFMSGHSHEVMAQHGLPGPGTEILGKSFASQQLVSAVSRALLT